jgi:hypothetical protein
MVKPAYAFTTPAKDQSTNPAQPNSMVEPPGYPKNPAGKAPVDGRPAAGIPADIPTISQGIQMMETCVNCGRAFPPDQFGAHAQQENEAPYSAMFDVDSGNDSGY